LYPRHARYRSLKMLLSRLSLGRIAVGWAVFLWVAALVLPQLDSRARAHPAVQVIILTVYGLFLLGTPIALTNYFIGAWRRIGLVPNRIAYVSWLSLESIAGIALLALLAYAALSLTAFHFR
jgi:hypothetical protein